MKKLIAVTLENKFSKNKYRKRIKFKQTVSKIFDFFHVNIFESKIFTVI